VIPTSEAASLPLFHYTRRLIEVAGHESVIADVDDPLDDAALVMGFGPACRRAANVRLGIWLSPDFRDAETAQALEASNGPGLVVGSLEEEGWDRAAAARLRQFEILHLTHVNRFLEVAGNPIGSVDVMRQMLGRTADIVRRIR
jgi:hypothetical protein